MMNPSWLVCSIRGPVWPHLSWAIEHPVILGNLNVLCQSLKLLAYEWKVVSKSLLDGYFYLVLQSNSTLDLYRSGTFSHIKNLVSLLLVLARMRINNMYKAIYLQHIFSHSILFEGLSNPKRYLLSRKVSFGELNWFTPASIALNHHHNSEQV
jgi:hypothetical protein